MVNPKIEEALRIKKSGFAKATRFLPTLVASELVFTCWECYLAQIRRIIIKDRRVLAELTTMSIGKTFGILLFDKIEEVEKDFSLNF